MKKPLRAAADNLLAVIARDCVLEHVWPALREAVDMLEAAVIQEDNGPVECVRDQVPPFYIRTADGKFVAGMIDGVLTWLSTEECE